MEEMGDAARVFLVFNDERERIDNELIEAWLAILNTLLIFVSVTLLLKTSIRLAAPTEDAYRLVYSPRSSPHLSPKVHNRYNRILQSFRHRFLLRSQPFSVRQRSVRMSI